MTHKTETKTSKPKAQTIGEQHIPMIGLAVDWWRTHLGLQRYAFHISSKPAAAGSMIESEIDEDTKTVTLYFGKFYGDLSVDSVAIMLRDELLRVLYRTADEAGFLNTLADCLDAGEAIESINDFLMPAEEGEERIFGEDLPRLDEDEEQPAEKKNKPTVH